MRRLIARDALMAEGGVLRDWYQVVREPSRARAAGTAFSEAPPRTLPYFERSISRP